MSYELHAEAETMQRAISIKMNTMEDAARFVSEMEGHGLWPEGSDAVIQHLQSGATWMYTDGWEPFQYIVFADEAKLIIEALQARLEVTGGEPRGPGQPFTFETRESIRTLISKLKAWLESRSMPA